MVKKISVFITILGLFFVGIPQFKTKAFIYEGTEYIPLVTTGTVTINNNVYYPLDINGFQTFVTFMDYMELNNLSKIEITSLNNLFDLYFHIGDGIASPLTPLNNAYKIELLLNNEGYYNMRILGIDNNVIDNIIIGYDFLNWNIPYNTMLVTSTKHDHITYGQAYDLGYDDARQEFGYFDWVNDTWRTAQEHADIAYENGYRGGRIEGYYEGLEENDGTGFIGLLGAVFSGLGTLLSIEILPNIHIGAIIAVPLVFGIIFFILGKRKGN